MDMVSRIYANFTPITFNLLWKITSFEIDRIEDLLVQIARRLGLFAGQKDVIPIEDVK